MAKSKVIIIAILASLAVCCLAACMGGTGTGGTGGNQTVDYTKTDEDAALSFSATEKNMTIGDTFVLSPSYNKILGYTMTYTSSNPSVASVNAKNGLVTALNAGTTTVKATYTNGAKTAEASLTVNCDFGGYLPEAKINGVSDGEPLTLIKGADFYLDASVLFNKITFDDGTFSYSVADSSVATVSGSTVTAVANGETTLKLSGSWRGKTLERTVDLKVVPEVIFLNDGKPVDDVVLYTVAEAGGKDYATSMPNKFKVLIDNVENETKVNIDDTTLVSKSFGKIVVAAGKYGSTTVSVSTQDGAYSKSFTITVKRPTVDVADVVPTFATDYGYYRDSSGDAAALLSFANEEGVAIDAYQGSRALTVDKNGYVFGIESSDSSKRGSASVTVGTNEILYNFELDVLAKYFASADDLKNLSITSEGYVRGYYELLCNIDAKGIELYHTGGGTFTGTFDGKGYTISNLTIASGNSMFGKLYAGSSISNLGLKNLKATEANFMFGDGSSTSGLTFNNIYIELSEDTVNPRGIGSTTGSGFTMNNVVVKYLGKNADADFVYKGEYRGLFLMGFWRYNDPVVKGKYILQGSYTDVYVISPYTLGFSPTDGYAADGNEHDKEANKKFNGSDNATIDAPVYAYGENETADLYGKKTSVGNQEAAKAPEYEDDNGNVAFRNTLYFNVVVPGVKHYKSTAECAANDNDDDKKNDYTSFSSTYWAVAGGDFVWLTAN